MSAIQSTAGKSALILGATGAVGRHLLKELLACPDFTRVGEFGRNVTASDKLEGQNTSKLEQKKIDFEKLEDAELKNGKWDVVFITLGTTRANAGSAEAFERIDREYVVKAAQAAKVDDSDHQQRLIYLSSMGANASSRLLYTRSKGLTENTLATLGYNDTIIVRPSALLGAERAGFRPLEAISLPIIGAMSWFSSNLSINVSQVGKGLRIMGQLGSTGLPPVVGATKVGPTSSPFTLIQNKGIISLTNEKA